jgi:hypothetical protein
MVYHKPLTTACKQLSFEPDNPSFAADQPIGKGISPNNTAVEKVTEQSPDKKRLSVKSDEGSVRFVSERNTETDESCNEVMVAYLVDKHDSLKSEDVVENKSVTKSTSQKGTRSSKRVRSGTQRQIRSKLLLDRIKQEKRKTASRSGSKNRGAAQKTTSRKSVNSSTHSKKTKESPAVNEKNRPREIQAKNRKLSIEETVVNEKNRSRELHAKRRKPSIEETVVNENNPSTEVQAKRKKPSIEESVDVKRSVRQKQNIRINKRPEVCLKKIPSSTVEPADVKPIIPCKHCHCSFKVI